MPKFRFATDSEYVARENEKTIPVCLGLQDENGKQGFYLHPRFLLSADKQKHEKFKSPFAPFDFYGLDHKPLKGKVKNTVTFEIFFFYSFKDIEFLFNDENDYVKYILPNLQRKRRITGKFKNGRSTIKLPWLVYCEGNDGKKRWHKCVIKLFDLCAMQGAGGLEKYANRVGIEMGDKHTFSQAEKENMDKAYLNRPFDMEKYCLGDLNLIPIFNKTNGFFNEIANILDIAPRDYWGLSTGKIVASLASAWLEKYLEIPEKTLHKLTDYAGSSGITSRKNLYKDKEFLYLGMVDGGRAARERMPENINKDFYTGFLLDCDIGGCYGVGLKHQIYAVGNPSLISEKMTLRTFLKQYESQMIAGLWYARVSAKNMPFKQDLLMSKTVEAFSTFDYEWAGDNDGFYCSDGKNVYQAQMVLLSNEIHQASLNHDLLQVMKYYTSEQEWSWLLDNMIVESALIYEKRNRVNEIKPEMFGDNDVNKHAEIRMLETINKNSRWVSVDLKELVDPLLRERKKYAKKTPMDEFLKLIINTIYGVICSEFFSTSGTGISNVIVANNITARARTLVWCMSKGLGTFMSITDGGVLNIEKVLNYKHTSLNVFENVYRNDYSAYSKGKIKNTRVWESSLVDENITPDMMNNYYMKSAFSDIVTQKESDTKIIDTIAWQHLKNIFNKLDLFSKDQFVFESKKWYSELILHSKVDYKLSNKYNERDKPFIAFRGVPKKWDEKSQEKIIDPKINRIFESVKRGVQKVVHFKKPQMLSLAEWEMIKEREKREKTPLENCFSLLPHDVIVKEKKVFAMLPMAYRMAYMSEFEDRKKSFEKAKEKEPDNIIKLTKRNHTIEKNRFESV